MRPLSSPLCSWKLSFLKNRLKKRGNICLITSWNQRHPNHAVMDDASPKKNNDESVSHKRWGINSKNSKEWKATAQQPQIDYYFPVESVSLQETKLHSFVWLLYFKKERERERVKLTKILTIEQMPTWRRELTQNRNSMTEHNLSHGHNLYKERNTSKNQTIQVLLHHDNISVVSLQRRLFKVFVCEDMNETDTDMKVKV